MHLCLVTATSEAKITHFETLTLQLFFEGVQGKVAQGVKESEISYQVAYSKQELRRVIREYPAREVKKGLDHLYRKVDKHLCEEENLLQVCAASSFIMKLLSCYNSI